MLPQQHLPGQMRGMKAAAVDQDNQVGEAEIALENHAGEIEIDQTVMTHHDHYILQIQDHT